MADIVTNSNVDYTLVDNTEWSHFRLLLIRDLDTGHDDDASFSPGGSYVFGVALMDNDGRNHIGAPKETLYLQPVTTAARRWPLVVAASG